MAFDLSQLGGLLSGAGGAGLAGGAAGQQPGLLDLIPAFRFQNDKFDISFDPEKEKRKRAIRRLIEQQTGQRVPETTTETAGGLGGIIGGANVTAAPNPFAQTSIPGFRGFGQGGF